MKETRIRFRLLGGIRARIGEHGEEPFGFRTAKAALLCAFLALRPDTDHPRDWLAAMLWPGQDERPTRLTNLASELCYLRKGLGAGAVGRDGNTIRTTRSTVMLMGDMVDVDVLRFDAALREARAAYADGNAPRRRAALERAMDLYAGPLLHGYSDPGDERGPHAWVRPERRRLERRHANALVELASLYVASPVGARQAREYALGVPDEELLTPENRSLLLRLLTPAAPPRASDAAKGRGNKEAGGLVAAPPLEGLTMNCSEMSLLLLGAAFMGGLYAAVNAWLWVRHSLRGRETEAEPGTTVATAVALPLPEVP